jgi:uncharacterized protein
MNVLRARRYGLPLILAVLLAIPAAAQNPAKGKRSDSFVKVTPTAEKLDESGKQVVVLKIEVDKHWHIYANPVDNSDFARNATKVKISGKSNPETTHIEYPKGKLVEDKTVGDYRIYEGTISIKASVRRAANDKEPLEVSVTFSACDDKGNCLLPATVKLTVP